jgi:peptidoglycan L-alanyl-D-glutamate endopeptidase CwlK
MSSRSLDDLLPDVQALAERHIAECAKIGIKLLVYCTHRSVEEQDALYAQGRSAPGPIVTRARGGESYHNFRRAYDCVPLDSHGNAWWSAPVELWERVGQIGEAVGLEWGGRWKRFKDRPHFQLTGGKTLAQLRGEYQQAKAANA